MVSMTLNVFDNGLREMRQMKKIKAIELGLENCEVISFKGEHLLELTMLDIKKQVSLMNPGFVAEFNICESLALRVAKEANIHASFESSFEDEQTPFERLEAGRDIVTVTIIHEDDEEMEFYTKWEDKEPYSNLYQTSFLRKDTGDLCIYVNANSTAEYYFLAGTSN